MNEKLLRSFVLEYKGEPLTKPFTTTREFGRWVEAVFTETEPMLVKKTVYIGENLRHPGTPIGAYFRDKPIINEVNRQRSFVIDSEVVAAIVGAGLCTLDDSNKLRGSDDTRYNVIKTYSVAQIELYLRDLKRDRKFSVAPMLDKPIIIKCTAKPYWIFDETASAVDSRFSLFGERKPVSPEQEQHFKKLAVIRNRYFDKDLMAIHIYSDGDEILNLYKMNTRKLGWEYIKASYNLQLQELYFEQGSEEWHDARIRRDGTFTLGRGVLTGKFPDLISGRYAMEFISEKGRFVVFMDGWVQPISNYRNSSE